MSGLLRRVKRGKASDTRVSGHRKAALTRKARKVAQEQIARMRELKIGPFAETTAIPDPNAAPTKHYPRSEFME